MKTFSNGIVIHYYDKFQMPKMHKCTFCHRNYSTINNKRRHEQSSHASKQGKGYISFINDKIFGLFVDKNETEMNIYEEFVVDNDLALKLLLVMKQKTMFMIL